MALDLQLRAAFARSVRDVEAAGEAGGDPSHKLLLAQKGKKGLEVAFRLLKNARSQVRNQLLGSMGWIPRRWTKVVMLGKLY